jgi:hypothetical protein
MHSSPIGLGILILLNAIVLLGQLWPEGAPPFARGVNIGFLILSLTYFLAAFVAARRAASPAAPPDLDRGA